ncbi:alpha-2-HS-glycoprotein-like [Chiloscyllium plagiosum]|uniref:alpha-2-HS-glycoprotein-like n=1 Tax=Chiloscyllium plagiosum TaxID=36176 RepID=UPI001CB84F6D|nr:alpha-2-HS-glycoprotein-like [Chiloscyllium plagiosum]
MKLFLAFTVCLQLFTSWTTALDNYVAVPCNGQGVLALAELTVDHINKQRTHGYKFSLDRIENVQELKEANGTSTYFLDIDLRETKCYVLNPKALNDCEIRSFKETKVEGDCKVLIETKPGVPGHVKGYKCEISPDSAHDVTEKCPDCAHLILINSTAAQHAAEVSLNKFNQESNNQHKFVLHEITRASSKGLGTPVLVEYVIRETPCRKDSEICPLIAIVNPTYGFCVSTVTPANSTQETIVETCELFHTKATEAVATVAEPEGKGDAAPVVKKEGGSEAPGTGTDADDGVEHVSPVPNNATASIVVEKSDSIPKRKRSIQDSSESSEEVLSSTGAQIIHFPDLPEDPTTCPTKHKYPEDQ